MPLKRQRNIQPAINQHEHLVQNNFNKFNELLFGTDNQTNIELHDLISRDLNIDNLDLFIKQNTTFESSTYNDFANLHYFILYILIPTLSKNPTRNNELINGTMYMWTNDNDTEWEHFDMKRTTVSNTSSHLNENLFHIQQTHFTQIQLAEQIYNIYTQDSNNNKNIFLIVALRYAAGTRHSVVLQFNTETHTIIYHDISAKNRVLTKYKLGVFNEFLNYLNSIFGENWSIQPSNLHIDCLPRLNAVRMALNIIIKTPKSQTWDFKQAKREYADNGYCYLNTILLISLIFIGGNTPEHAIQFINDGYSMLYGMSMQRLYKLERILAFCIYLIESGNFRIFSIRTDDNEIEYYLFKN
jgi:hypothetical protein